MMAKKKDIILTEEKELIIPTGDVTIIATEKACYLTEGEEYLVGNSTALRLVLCGKAKLKQ